MVTIKDRDIKYYAHCEEIRIKCRNCPRYKKCREEIEDKINTTIETHQLEI